MQTYETKLKTMEKDDLKKLPLLLRVIFRQIKLLPPEVRDKCFDKFIEKLDIELEKRKGTE